MPWWRATVIDQNRKTHRVELFAGCLTNVRQALLTKFGVLEPSQGMQSKPIGGKIDIIIKDIQEISHKE